MRKMIAATFIAILCGVALAQGWVEAEPGSNLFFDTTTLRQTAPKTIRLWSKIGRSGPMNDSEIREVNGYYEIRQAAPGGRAWSAWAKADPNSASGKLYRAAEKLPKKK